MQHTFFEQASKRHSNGANVFFTSPTLQSYEVLYIPRAGGEKWHIFDNGLEQA